MSTLSTPDSKKRVLATVAVTIAFCAYGAETWSLIALSNWAESELGSLPFRSEDWLRYQIPSLMKRGNQEAVLLTGPSAVRENFLIHAFEQAMPRAKVILGAASVATLEDNILGLEYMERAYGRSQLPRTIVLGITARSVSGINHDFSPLQSSFDRYSPSYGVERQAGGVFLVEKPLVSGVKGNIRFLLKQPTRYKSTLAAVGSYLLPPPNDPRAVLAETARLRAIWAAVEMRPNSLDAAGKAVGKLGLWRSIDLWLQLYASPYKYHHLRPFTPAQLEAWLTEEDSYWHQVQRWNAKEHEREISLLFNRLIAFVERHGCRLFIVTLPEHPDSVRRYQGLNYQHYLDVVRASIGDTPYVDLHDYCSANEFYDVVHLTPEGAIRLSDRVIGFLRANRPSR